MDKEEKYRKNMICLDLWMTAHERGNYIPEYLNDCQIKSVGIYGYGMLGKHLVHELRNKNFPIQWVMDRFSSGDEMYKRIVSPGKWENQKDVDLAVITTLADLEEIEMFLSKFVTGWIISIEELVGNMCRWGLQK